MGLFEVYKLAFLCIKIRRLGCAKKKAAGAHNKKTAISRRLLYSTEILYRKNPKDYFTYNLLLCNAAYDGKP